MSCDIKAVSVTPPPPTPSPMNDSRTEVAHQTPHRRKKSHPTILGVKVIVYS